MWPGTYKAFKNTFDHCRQKFTKKRDPKKDEMFEKWNLESIDDSPFSLFYPSESEDVTQLANEYGG